MIRNQSLVQNRRDFSFLWDRAWKVHALTVLLAVLSTLVLALIFKPEFTLYAIFFSTVSSGLVSYVVTKVVNNYRTAIHRKNRQLAERNYELQQLNQLLQQSNGDLEAFSYTVAHDLKSPLTSIVGSAELLTLQLQSAGISDPTFLQNNERIVRSGKKMSDIIDALLLLASIGQKEVAFLPLSMDTIMRQVQERLDPIIVDTQARITLPDSWENSVGFAPWVEEIWVNYISNAIKYGGEPPELLLGSEQQANGQTRFWVQDNGAGIDKTAQSKLFREFSRLHHDNIEGHGLGLAIVQRIAGKLGGTVGVESEVGHGSCFYFTLPTSGE
jgi:signal transduction histidine kinase